MGKYWYLLLLFILPMHGVYAAKNIIAIVYNPQSGLSHQVSKALKTNLSENYSTKEFVFSMPSLKEELNNNKPTVILSIGSRPLQMLIQKQVKLPILSTFIPKASFYNIINKANYTPDVSVIFLDQPYARQLKLCRLLFPKKSKVGILFGPQSQNKVPLLERKSKELGLNLVSHTMSNEKELKVALNKIIRSSDYLLLIADDRVVTHPNNAKFILQFAYVARIPVVGFSNSFVQAGGTAAIYSTPKQIGTQAAEILNRRIQAAKNAKRLLLPAIKYPKYFTVKINSHAAYLLGVNADSNEIKSKLDSK